MIGSHGAASFVAPLAWSSRGPGCELRPASGPMARRDERTRRRCDWRGRLGMAIETCETVLAVVLVVGFLLIAHLAVVLDMTLSRRRRRARRR